MISLMIGSVVVREAPDSMFPLNGTNGTELIDVAARDARRVHVAMALTALVGLIQVRCDGSDGPSLTLEILT